MESEGEYEKTDYIAWLFYTGMTRLGLTEENVGEITVTKFYRLYEQYKVMFDQESVIKRSQKTYMELEYEPTLDDAMPF